MLPLLLTNLNANEGPNPLSPITTFSSYSHPYQPIGFNLHPQYSHLHVIPSYLSHPTTKYIFHMELPLRRTHAKRSRPGAAAVRVAQYSPSHVTYRVSSETLTNENVLSTL